MKANDLVHIIRKIVAEEIRKELPMAISEVFQNFMGKRQTISETSPDTQIRNLESEPESDNSTSTRQSLRELFEGTNVMRTPVAKAEPKRFTKNPLLNDILNETRPFNSQERHGSPMGASAMAAAVASQYGGSHDVAMPDVGVMGSNTIVPPVSQAQLMSESHVPMSNLPEGVSVLDVKNQVPDVVSRALKRNYSDFMKKVELKVKK